MGRGLRRAGPLWTGEDLWGVRGVLTRESSPPPRCPCHLPSWGSWFLFRFFRKPTVVGRREGSEGDRREGSWTHQGGRSSGPASRLLGAQPSGAASGRRGRPRCSPHRPSRGVHPPLPAPREASDASQAPKRPSHVPGGDRPTFDDGEPRRAHGFSIRVHGCAAVHVRVLARQLVDLQRGPGQGLGQHFPGLRLWTRLCARGTDPPATAGPPRGRGLALPSQAGRAGFSRPGRRGLTCPCRAFRAIGLTCLNLRFFTSTVKMIRSKHSEWSGRNGIISATWLAQGPRPGPRLTATNATHAEQRQQWHLQACQVHTWHRPPGASGRS